MTMVWNTGCTPVVALACIAGLALAPAMADDWPTYRGDSQRSGVSTETLDFPLREAWTHRALQSRRTTGSITLDPSR